MKNEILIPTEWNDVTLEEFINLSALDISKFENPIEYYIHMLRIFGNDNIDEIFEYVKTVDLANIVEQMSFVNTPPQKLDIKEVKIDGTLFKLTENMNELTVGEYVTIESIIERDKLDTVSAIPAILSVVLRPIDEVFDSNLCDSRMKLFKENLSIEETLGMSGFFFDWRSVIMYNFSALFKGVEKEDDDVTVGAGAPVFSDRWKWFSIIERLANSDITKFEEVYKQSYISALNLLSYWKEKDDYQKRLEKRQAMMSKHSR